MVNIDFFIQKLNGTSKGIALAKIRGRRMVLKREFNSTKKDIEKLDMIAERLRKKESSKDEFMLTLDLEGGFE